MAFDPSKLTVKAGEALQRAQQLAERRQHRLMRPIHMLKSLLEEEQGIVRPLFQKMGVPLPQLTTMIDGELNRIPQSSGGNDEPAGAGSEAVKVLHAAQKQAESMGDQFTSTEHLIIALTQVEDQTKRLLQLN
ncbi:MAG: Clp protease N-terminal domain-containing protein, partial [Planctomyces sp.]